MESIKLLKGSIHPLNGVNIDCYNFSWQLLMMVTKVSTDLDCKAISVWQWLWTTHLLTAPAARFQKIHRKIQNGNCLNGHPTREKREWHTSNMWADRHSNYPFAPFPYRNTTKKTEPWDWDWRKRSWGPQWQVNSIHNLWLNWWFVYTSESAPLQFCQMILQGFA